MARSPHLSLDLLQEAFYKGLYETFEISNEEREQLQQAQVEAHRFDHIERALSVPTAAPITRSK
jgi:hypothetical protein